MQEQLTESFIVVENDRDREAELVQLSSPLEPTYKPRPQVPPSTLPSLRSHVSLLYLDPEANNSVPGAFLGLLHFFL